MLAGTAMKSASVRWLWGEFGSDRSTGADIGIRSDMLVARGRITDREGRPIAGAKVSATSAYASA